MQGAKKGGVAYSKAMTKCKFEICLSEVNGFSLSFQLLYILKSILVICIPRAGLYYAFFKFYTWWGKKVFFGLATKC